MKHIFFPDNRDRRITLYTPHQLSHSTPILPRQMSMPQMFHLDVAIEELDEKIISEICLAILPSKQLDQKQEHYGTI